MTETMLPPCVLLTRPAAQSVALAGVFDSERVIVSPLLEIAEIGDVPELGGFGGLIFSSPNGVAALARRTGARDLPVWTVGETTRDTARAEGWSAEMAGLTADELVARLLASGGPGATPLLHIRGHHASRPIAALLSAGGLPCTEAVLYDQRSMSLTAEARMALQGNAPVICPLYSPRTAHLFAAQVTEAIAPLHLVAMSDTVAEALGKVTYKSLNVAGAPTGAAMRDSVRAMCAQLEAEAGAH